MTSFRSSNDDIANILSFGADVVLSNASAASQERPGSIPYLCFYIDVVIKEDGLFR